MRVIVLFACCLFKQILFCLCCILWIEWRRFVYLINLYIFALLFVFCGGYLVLWFLFRIHYKPHCLGLENSTHNIYRLYPVVNGGPHPLLGSVFSDSGLQRLLEGLIPISWEFSQWAQCGFFIFCLAFFGGGGYPVWYLCLFLSICNRMEAEW